MDQIHFVFYGLFLPFFFCFYVPFHFVRLPSHFILDVCVFLLIPFIVLIFPYRSHCVCDDMLFDCLKKLDNTPAAQVMGTIYFNIVQVRTRQFFSSCMTQKKKCN